MNKEQLVKIVDEVAEGLLEGGPGSGRYPEGSGKNPDSKKGDGNGSGNYAARGSQKNVVTPTKVVPKERDMAAKVASIYKAGFKTGLSKVKNVEDLNKLYDKVKNEHEPEMWKTHHKESQDEVGKKGAMGGLWISFKKNQLKM